MEVSSASRAIYAKLQRSIQNFVKYQIFQISLLDIWQGSEFASEASKFVNLLLVLSILK